MAKDSSRTTAGELQKTVEPRVRKTKKRSNSPYISTCCSGRYQEKLSSIIQKQTLCIVCLYVYIMPISAQTPHDFVSFSG